MGPFYDAAPAEAVDNGPSVNENQHINIENLTSYEEMSSFLEKVDEEAEHIHAEVIGESVKGRDLYLAKFGNKFNDPNTPTLLILTQQHGNEALVTESAMNIIQKLSTNNKEVKALLDEINILFVPRLNVDGAEGDVDWDTSNLYRGGVQTRTNANGINLNRTHNSLSQPETRALHENVLQEYDIDYAIDFHHQIANRATDDGELVSGALQYPTNDNVSDEVLEHSKQLGAVVHDAVEPKGYSNLARYGSDNTSTSTARNNFPVQYDIPTLLFETRGLTDSINASSILGQKGNGYLINQGEVAMMATIRAIAEGSIENTDISMWNSLPEQHTVEEK